jgi:hypothetical protein
MEFRGVGSRVSGRVGGRVRDEVRDAAALPAAEAQGGEVERGRDRRVGKLRLGQEAQGCARLGQRAAAAGSGGARLRCSASERLPQGQEVADPGAVWRGLERLRATTSVQCAFVDAPFAFSVTERLVHPGSRAAVLGTEDGPRASGELGASR